MTWAAPWMQSRPSNQLGAIVGRKRLEFRVPSRVFDDLTLGRAQAVCIGYTSGIDELIQAGFDARNYDFLPKDIENLRTRIYAEEKKMRSRGVQGRIPVCVFRKDWQGRLNKYQRRAEATHERFHADYRRRESERGLDDGDTCVIGNIGAELVYHMGDEGRNAYGAGELLGWAGNNLSVLPEEVLARTEEVRHACRKKKDGTLKDPTDCAESNRHWAEQFVRVNSEIEQLERQIGTSFRLYGIRLDPSILWRLSARLDRKYGGARGLVQNSIDKCKAPAGADITKKRFDRYARRVSLARKRGEYLPVAKRPDRVKPQTRASMIELF